MGQLNHDTKLTWLGHATWRIESPGGKKILIDPFLVDNPSCPAAYKSPAALADTDLILVTHGHFDHVADVVPVAKASGATVVGIYDLTSWLAAKGVANTAGMNKGGGQDVAGLHVTLTDAVHSSTAMEHDTPVDLGDPCGFVIEFENGFTLYVAGDTAVFGDMALIRELYSPDAAILPIGDYFTMGPREAAKAVELLGVKHVIPSHYGTFGVLTGTPEALVALVGGDVEVHTVAPGGTLG